MTPEELRDLVIEVRRQGSELSSIEVKSAHGGTPLRSVRESLSAFANRTNGGVLLFGLDEERGFEIVGVGDAQRLQEEVGNLAANDMEPALRPEFTVAAADGRAVVAVEVPETPALQKPCYYRPAGLQSGAFIRVGPSNRRMTDYEIFGYVSSREQPRFDTDPVSDALIADLDWSRVDAYLAQLREERGRPTYLDRPVENVLRQLRIIREADGVLRPTLAGLLAFGRYPQASEPQLMITYVQFFGTDESEPTPTGARFLDNRRFEGAIPIMVEGAVNHVLASIRRSSLIDGVFRRDIPEYPAVAIREAIVNAVAHRDYSHYVRGSYVQIRLFADRLEIQSPGGLYGSVTEESLERETSTRNPVLIRLLEDLRVVENRGSGIRSMLDAMRAANLEPPRFEDRRSSFQVIFRNYTLMSSEDAAWINQFADRSLSDRQRLALVYLRHNGQITNADYRRLNHIDAGTATNELRGLVQVSLVRVHATGRSSYYSLLESAAASRTSANRRTEDLVLAYIEEHGSITNSEFRALLGTSFERASYVLTRMHQIGLLRREGRGRWTTYHLP